jgi:hypothetical protein
MKIGNALLRTRVLMWPGASASLSLMTSCLRMMMMRPTMNCPREIMNLAITLLRLNVVPLPLPLPNPREKRILLLLLLLLLVIPRQDPKKCHLDVDKAQGTTSLEESVIYFGR